MKAANIRDDIKFRKQKKTANINNDICFALLTYLCYGWKVYRKKEKENTLSEGPAFSTGFDSRRFVKKTNKYKKKLGRGLLMLLVRTSLTMFQYLIQGYGVMIPSCF